MSLSILTYYLPNYARLAALTLPNREEYCARHGYSHVVQTQAFRDPGQYYAIDRLWWLLDLMGRPGASDLYWVFNVSSVITNMGRPVTDYLDSDHSLYITRDVNGLNAGSMVIRNDEMGRELVRFVAEAAAHVNHCWFEQKVLQDNELHPRFGPRIKVLPHPSIQSYDYLEYKWPDTTPGHWHEGDLVLALPGLNLDQRVDRIQRWLKRVVR